MEYDLKQNQWEPLGGASDGGSHGRVLQVEEKLDLHKLTEWLDGLEETTVSVQIPRFRVEDGFSLKEKLQALGLTELFTPQASLPGTTPRPP